MKDSVCQIVHIYIYISISYIFGKNWCTRFQDHQPTTICFEGYSGIFTNYTSFLLSVRPQNIVKKKIYKFCRRHTKLQVHEFKLINK